MTLVVRSTNAAKPSLSSASTYSKSMSRPPNPLSCMVLPSSHMIRCCSSWLRTRADTRLLLNRPSSPRGVRVSTGRTACGRASRRLPLPTERFPASPLGRGTAGTDGGFSPCACGLGHCRRGYSRRHLGLAPASAGVRRSDAGLPHYGGMVAQSAFLPVIGLRCTALSARHGHDALAHFHFTKPPLYAAVPLVVAVPQAPVAGGLCLSQPSTLYIEEQSS